MATDRTMPVHRAATHIAFDGSDAAALSAWRARITRVLSDTFDLGELKGRIVPVQYRDQSVALCLLPEYVHSDPADELERLVLAKGWMLSDPARITLPAAVLLELADGARTSGQRVTPDSRAPSALGAAFDEIIQWAVTHGASDIHFNVRLREALSELRFSIEGRYVAPAHYQSFPTATALDMLAVAWMRVRGGNGAIFDPGVEQQGRILMTVSGRPVMLRWASLAADAGPSVCLRILRLDETVAGQSLADLGYLPTQITAFMTARDQAGGAVVLAGAVGSGKSTTLATLLSGLGTHRKLVTVEDPVEYLIPGALQNTLSRTLDSDDHHVFDAKLRTIKRSAVDDLLIGEVRDLQTGRAFMDLSASGTRVYATTHTHAAVLIPERLSSDFIGISRDLLASPGILKLLVYQTLLPKLCLQCAEPWRARRPGLPAGLTGAAADDDGIERLLDANGISLTNVRVRCSSGCGTCRRPGLDALWGYDGRTVAAEWIAPADDATVLDCIRARNVAELARHVRNRRCTRIDDPDMRGKSVDACALYKVSQGQVDPRDLFATLPRLTSWGDGA